MSNMETVLECRALAVNTSESPGDSDGLNEIPFVNHKRSVVAD